MASVLPLPPPNLRFMGRFDEELLQAGDTIGTEREDVISPQPTDTVFEIAARRAAHALHVCADAIVHHLGEIRSMLGEGGRVMATFFITNHSQQTVEAAGRSRHPLPYGVSDLARCWDVDDPLQVIACNKGWSTDSPPWPDLRCRLSISARGAGG